MKLWIHHFVGNVLAYTVMPRAPIVQCLMLPFGGVPAREWGIGELGLEHSIHTFSVQPERNLCIVLEEWFVNQCVG